MTATDILDYQHNAPAIARLVGGFHHRFGGDLEEYQSAANEAYLKAVRSHKPAKGGLLPRVLAAVRYDLLKCLKRRQGYGRADWHEKVTAPEQTNATPATLDRAVLSKQHWLTDFLDGLGEDARQVAQAVLDAPGELLYELCWQPDGKQWFGVWRWLRGLAWTAERISAAFREIREALG